MNIYTIVMQHCQTADTAWIQRLVGTLRAAGFADEVPTGELPLVEATLEDLSARRQLRTAKVAKVDQGRKMSKSPDRINSVDGMDRFIEIEAYIEKGQCPRCHVPMAKVRLGSHVIGGKEYMQANYCKACRTTLWTK